MPRPVLRGLLGLLGLLCLAGVTSCGSDGEGPRRWDPETSVQISPDVRFSWPSPHLVLAQRRTTDGWSDPVVVVDDDRRECGAVRALHTGDTVAATLACDEHFAEDQAPTASVAVISAGDGWETRDLQGEAYSTPGLSPDGSHAVWVQDGDLLTWKDGDFGSAPAPDGYAQVVTVEDDGEVVALAPGESAGQCTVEATAAGGRTTVFVAPSRDLLCDEVGLSLASPSEVHGDVNGQDGTEFVVRRAGASGWTLTTPPPVTAPGLAAYPDDPARAVWNQLTRNTSGDLVAAGSPDRQHLTAQRYDPDRQRWTSPRVVHDAGAPVCRRAVEDSGVLQGATFRLRFVCGGEAVVLRSRTGETWSS